MCLFLQAGQIFLTLSDRLGFERGRTARSEAVGQRRWRPGLPADCSPERGFTSHHSKLMNQISLRSMKAGHLQREEGVLHFEWEIGRGGILAANRAGENTQEHRCRELDVLWPLGWNQWTEYPGHIERKLVIIAESWDCFIFH